MIRFPHTYRPFRRPGRVPYGIGIETGIDCATDGPYSELVDLVDLTETDCETTLCPRI
jgi:hypothetical protein